MHMECERSDGVETIELSQRPTTVCIVVSIMALALNLQIGLVLMVQPLDWILIGLLVLCGGSAAWLGAVALQSLLPTRVVMSRERLLISRLLGEDKFEWIDVGEAKLVPSVGALSDDATGDASGRLAVGLFLKSRKAPRAHDLDADVIIYGAAETHLSALVRLVDHINDYKSTIGSGLPDPQRRVRKAAPIAAPTAFRRPRSAA